MRRLPVVFNVNLPDALWRDFSAKDL